MSINLNKLFSFPWLFNPTISFSVNKTNILFSINTNHYNSSDLIIKNHISSSLKLFEINRNKRYKKFIGFQYTGIQFNNSYYIRSNIQNKCQQLHKITNVIELSKT